MIGTRCLKFPTQALIDGHYNPSLVSGQVFTSHEESVCGNQPRTVHNPRQLIFSDFRTPRIPLSTHFMYRTCAIISRGLYIFYPISKDHFFVFKEVFSENSVLMHGLYSRAACNQERLMIARVW